MARGLVALLMLTGPLLSCAAALPALDEVNDVVVRLREYRAWAWAAGILGIWADLVLPVPQTALIAALGICYGTLGGGVVGSLGIVTGGWLGWALARRFGRGPVSRLVGVSTLERVERLFERGGVWAIVLTRSLPYSIPEAVVVAAGLSGMRASRLLVALGLGGVPTAFVFSAVGAGWTDQPALALAASYALPIPLVPLALYLLRRRRGSASGASS